MLYRNLNNNRWTRAKIINKHAEPRSYIIKDSLGRNYRRTSYSYHLRKAYGDYKHYIKNYNSISLNNETNQSSETNNYRSLNQPEVCKCLKTEVINCLNNQNNIFNDSSVQTGRPQRNVRLTIKYHDYDLSILKIKK